MNLALACMIFLVTFAQGLCAADYYVDSNKGNDSASGTTAQEAWRAAGLTGISMNPRRSRTAV